MNKILKKIVCVTTQIYDQILNFSILVLGDKALKGRYSGNADGVL